MWDKDGNKLNINLKSHPNFLRTKTWFCRTNLESFLHLFACLFANHPHGLLFQHSHNVRCSKFLIYRICLLSRLNYPFKRLPYFSFQLFSSCCLLCWGWQTLDLSAGDTVTVNSVKLHSIFQCQVPLIHLKWTKNAQTIFCSHHSANSCLSNSLASSLSALQISNFLSCPQMHNIFPQLLQSGFAKTNLILSYCVSNLSQSLCTAVLLTLLSNH